MKEKGTEVEKPIATEVFFLTIIIVVIVYI
jgi:hypothetical protein